MGAQGDRSQGIGSPSTILLADSNMAVRNCAVAVALLSQTSEAAYPTACSAYTTCAGLQGDCCPNMQGVNLACCFSGALQMDADAAEAEAKKVAAEADRDTA